MKKLSTGFYALFLLGMVFLAEACQSSKSASATKMLRFDLAAGKGYDYEMLISLDQEMMGQKIEIDMSNYYSMEVKADDGNQKTIETILERLKAKTVVAGMAIEIDTDETASYDSTDFKKDPITAIKALFSSMKGQRFVMKVDREGKIREVSGFKSMGENLAQKLGLEGESRATMMKSFDEQFNEQEMANNFDRFWYVFPNKEVKLGDSWTKRNETSGKMPAIYHSTYKVTDIEGDMVTLEETTQISGKDGEIMSFTGTISGTVVVDSRSGLMVNSDQDMNMKTTAGGSSFEIIGKSKIKGKARE